VKYFIGVAAHKPYSMSKNVIYHPIQVNAENNSLIRGYIPDNTGHNISKLNSSFSELTAAYYIWKNVSADYKGLVHYRRYLGKTSIFFAQPQIFDRLLDECDLDELFSEYDAVIPRKRHYFIESNESHYKHAHHIEALMITKKVIETRYPEYFSQFCKQLERKSAHMFNMYIMKAQTFDAYHAWLFDILFTVKDHLDISQYSSQEKRAFGYVSELLLDVWLDTNNIHYVERPVLYVERQHLIKKGIGLISRKIVGHGETHIHSSID